MGEKVRTDFCTACRRETEYVLKKKTILKTIKEKEYSFIITVAICVECGEEMSIPGLIDKNIREMDEQYRMAEGILTVDDIVKLMKLYRLGKAPLSLTLGFGEITITRYLAGQIPSKEYSDVMKTALSSPVYMKQCLAENKDKLADTAYQKAMDAASQLEEMFSVSKKMLRVISHIFKNLEEVTPLMLQKLLYFAQGISLALYDEPLFPEDCEAWVHGPVYPEVYNLFKDFKYNPIEDARFAVINGTSGKLTSSEQKVIDLVVNTFGLYGGKVLERITHNEEPWKMARRGYGDQIPSKEPISMEQMEAYYKAVNKEYGIHSEKGLKRYIQDMIQKEEAFS